MNITKQLRAKKQLRIKRARAKITGTAEKPRLSVFRSLKYIEAQLIDDVKGHTIIRVHDAQISDKKKEKGAQPRVAIAEAVGKKIAELAVKKGITQAVFDRRGSKFHGRVAAVAKGARAGGLHI